MKKLIIIPIFLSIFIFIAACGPSGGNSAPAGKTVQTATVNNLTITLSTTDGVIRNGTNDFTLSFTDASGKTVEVGAASVNFLMPAMGTMPAMNDAATLTTTGTAGVFNGKVKLEMGGEWQVQIAFEGAAGKGKTSFPIMAR